MTKQNTLTGLALGILLALSFLALPAAASAQSMSMQVEGDDIEGQPYTIGELGALVFLKSGKLEVFHVLGKEMRPKAYRSVDIQVGDLLIMLNGSRLKTIEDLQSALEGAETGKKLKFGIKRGKDMRMLSFAKADPESLPKMQTKTMSFGGDGEGHEGAMKMGGAVTMLPGSGIIASLSDSAIVIAALMPDADKALKEGGANMGDRIISLQGTKITDLEQLSEIFEGIAVGDEIKLTLANADKEFTVMFKKQKFEGTPGMMMIKN